LHEVWVYS